jgi:hypothetical protein
MKTYFPIRLQQNLVNTPLVYPWPVVDILGRSNGV